jgi:hypothetical protein
MNVGLHHRGVDAEFLAVFQTELDDRLDHGFVDGLERGRGEAVEARLKASCLGTRWLSNCVKPRSV